MSNIGEKMMTYLSSTQIENKIVADFMEFLPVSVNLHDPISYTIEQMLRYDMECIAVVNEAQKVQGMVSFQIITSALVHGSSLEEEIQNIKISHFTTCYVDDLVMHLPFEKSIPVIDENEQLIGYFSSTKKFLTKSMATSERIQFLEQTVEIYEVCFNVAYEGIVIVDQNGIIKLFNNSYSRFVKMRKEDVIGKHCTDVIENTRLPVVLETGIPERSNVVVLQGQEMVAHVIPIWKEGSVIGAVGMLVFEGVSELSKAFERMVTLKDKSNQQPLKLEFPKKKSEPMTFEKIIGDSDEIGEAKKIARRAAKTMATILITGESGVGKEIFTKSIHHISPVKNGPLISINCAAIPEELLESELFGYNGGAFTGAKKGGKPGKFELAHNGTLFLDEIGDMPLTLQAKLLRVLQEQTFERIGGTDEIHVNVRIIAATNQPLEQLVEMGSFRKDLYYRLNIISLPIPPLRNRKKDIPLLVGYLLEKACQKHQLPPVEINKKVMERFIHYDWPGNIREMENLLERLVVLADKEIRLEELPLHIIGNHNATSNLTTSSIRNGIEFPPKTDTISPPSTLGHLLASAKQSNEDQEREMIAHILQQVNGNKVKAAKMLGIHRSTLYKKMKKYRLK